MKQAVINAVSAQANLANHQANLTVDSNISGAYIQVRASTNLNAGYYTNATLDTRNFAIGPILAAYAPGSAGDLTGC